MPTPAASKFTPNRTSERTSTICDAWSTTAPSSRSGGGLSSREPMALLRAMLRRGVTDLTVVGSAHGIDIDLLSAGGALARSSESYVGFEQDFGMAPNYRRALEVRRGRGRRQLLLHFGATIARSDPGPALHAATFGARHELCLASSRVSTNDLPFHRRGIAAGSGDRTRRRAYSRAVWRRKGQPRHPRTAGCRPSLREGVEE